MTDGEATVASDLAFRARALAQAHPLSPAAHRIVTSTVARESRSQPLEEAGVWAGAALTQGYCLRCVQEVASDRAADLAGALDDDALDRAAVACADALRAGTGEELTVAVLDLLIESQVGHRLDQWRDDLEPSAWSELEQYVAWWVVKGYGLRVAETTAPVA